jgi:transcriptional regulator with XRE-family HTH domain
MKDHRIPDRAKFRAEPAQRIGANRQKLTDYVVQVASNALLPVDIMVKALVPWPTGDDSLRYSRRPFASGQNLALVNAHGQTASCWVRHLNELTGRNDLDALTLLPFADVLCDPRGLVRPGRQWCPVCLQEDLSNGAQIYERLIWSIRLVSWCPLHDVPLAGTCPNCDHSHRAEISRRSLSGFCAQCHQWLGMTRHDYHHLGRTARDALLRENFFADQFSALLAIPESSLKHVSKQSVIQMLEGGVARIGDGNADRFAEASRRSASSIAEWRSGHVFPSISSILDMCAIFGISLDRWLTGDTSAWENVSAMHEHPVRVSIRDARSKARDWLMIEKELRQSIDCVGYHLSWEKTAARFEIDPSFLRGRFPDIANRIVKKARAHRSRMSTVRRIARNRALVEQVRQVVNDLIASNCSLRRRDIEAELTNRGVAFRWSDFPVISTIKIEAMDGSRIKSRVR